MNVSGHCVLITGGSSGIGLALAIRLAELGNQVLIVGSSQRKLDEAVGACPKLIPYLCNLEKVEDLPALTARVLREHPKLNMLVNNAGIQLNYDLKSEPHAAAHIAREIQVNFGSLAHLCASFLPHLVQQPQAAIVNVSSGLGLVPKKSAPIYCATKAAVHLFTKSLRYQMAGTNVRVFEVIPPLVQTAMTAGRAAGAMTPERLVEAVLRGFARDRYELPIGQTRLLQLVQRLSPALADRILRDA